MTDYTELVARLRAWFWPQASLANEAADAITAQAAELREHREKYAGITREEYADERALYAAELARVTAERDAARAWRLAIDEAMVAAHIGVADETSDPHDCLNRLLEWHHDVWLDPAVCSEAQALVDRGTAAAQARIAELEALALHAADLLDDASACTGLGPDAALRWFSCKGKFRATLASTSGAEPPPVVHTEAAAWMLVEWGRPVSLHFGQPPKERGPRDDVTGAQYVALYASPPAAELKTLSDEEILACVRSVLLPRPMGLTRDVGPYDVTEPSYYLTQLVRAIERAMAEKNGGKV